MTVEPLSNTLEQIVATKKKRLSIYQQARSVDTLRKALEDSGKQHNVRRFAQCLQDSIRNNKIAIIAECKRASPSAGLICSNYNPEQIAQSYSRAGASCVSVLTEEDFFQGQPEHLEIIAQNCNIPVLCKDFIIDEWQIFHARLIGADCILLIAALLTKKQLKFLARIARECGLDTLVEVHNEDELERALACGATLIGINNRNLKDLSIDVNTSVRLRQQIPSEYLVVSESGISSAQTMAMLCEHGLSIFLIGEHLMRSVDPGNALANLLTQLAKINSDMAEYTPTQ